MQQGALTRDAYRRVGDLSAQIQRLAPGQWHATITMMQPGSSLLDETFPVVDLGIFPTIGEARAATDSVVENWVSI